MCCRVQLHCGREGCRGASVWVVRHKKKKIIAGTRRRGVGEDVGGEGEKRTIKTVTDKTKSTTIPKYRLQPASRGDSQHS